jgi:formate hydrogenlyase subunit 3/multisubunit Na+/H+ antiporter MnhD subunit
MTHLPLAIVVVPLALAAGVLLGGAAGRAARALAPWAALPALLLALVPHPPAEAVYPSLLLGTRLGLDVTGQVFLLLAGVLWTVAGVYARAYHADDAARPRMFLFWLLTLAGNLGLVVADDAASFYLFFALMTFSAYGLVVHAGSAAALRAGRVYVVMAVLGEGMLLTGLLLAASGADGMALDAFPAAVAAAPHRDWIVGLLLAGFGIKAGALPLHVWLPLAHPVAPTPASAVLSGCMIKAGLLGWLRFLPLGEAALPAWGIGVVAVGVLASFFGVAAGAVQRDPKTALAYSSISQMGFMNVAVGIGLAAPDAWPFALAACLAYAVHHGLAKGALFLGVGVAAAASGRTSRTLALAGLAFAALAVAGAPLTSGSVAKGALKAAAARVPEWPGAMEGLLSLAAVGTTLLMGRFLMLASRQRSTAGGPPVGLWLPWAALLAAVGGVLWWVPGRYELEMDAPYLPGPGAVWVYVWPVVAGAVLLWALVTGARRMRIPPERAGIAAGDVLVPVERLLAALRRRISIDLPPLPDPVGTLAARWHGVYAESDRRGVLARAEGSLTRWSAAAALFVAVAAVLAVLLTVQGST